MTRPDDDFATLFAASIRTSQVRRGQTVEGRIVAIGPEVAFVNIGGKGEATIALAELKGDDGALEVGVGDRIQATVVSTDEGVTLSRHLIRAAASIRQIEAAYRAGLPVEGRVDQVIKGGYEVRVGRSRAFCPFSQIDVRRTADPAEHIGRVYTFRISEFREGGRNLVVSRRALLEQAQQAEAAAVRRRIVPDAVLSGRIVSVRDFGAFVDLGAGVHGLLHVSEMGWSRLSDATEVVAPGDTVTVRVLRVDDEGRKIALGLRQPTDDPWTTAAAKYPVGRVCRGRVARIADFGVFLDLEAGVTGLIPLGEADVADVAGRADLAKVYPPGRQVDVIVLEVDAAARRLRLSRRGVRSLEEAADLRESAERQGTAATGALGSLADKLRGVVKSR